MNARELAAIDELFPGEEPGGLMSERVRRIEYDHVEDEGDAIRVHDFRRGVRMHALPGGKGVVIYRPRGRVWMDF